MIAPLLIRPVSCVASAADSQAPQDSMSDAGNGLESLDLSMRSRERLQGFRATGIQLN